MLTQTIDSLYRHKALRIVPLCFPALYEPHVFWRSNFSWTINHLRVCAKLMLAQYWWNNVFNQNNMQCDAPCSFDSDYDYKAGCYRSCPVNSCRYVYFPKNSSLLFPQLFLDELLTHLQSPGQSKNILCLSLILWSRICPWMKVNDRLHWVHHWTIKANDLTEMNFRELSRSLR